MSVWRNVTLTRARRYADQFVNLIAEDCIRTAVAGEVRRAATHHEQVTSSPLEIVAVPVILEQRDMFEERLADRNLLLEVVKRLIDSDRLEERIEKKRGARRQPNDFPMRLLFRADGGMLCPLDLWETTAARFGAVLALRTGPYGLHSGLTSPVQTISPSGRAGLIPRGMQCSERTGLILRDGLEIETPEERSFFDAIGVPMVRPEDRL